MIITKIPEEFPETVFRQSHERSAGVHLSTVVRDLEMTLYPNRYNGTSRWDLNAAAQVGVFWEVMLEMAYGEMFAADIGEVELDGIVGTPDGIGEDEEGVHLEEFKATWKSSKKTPVEVFYYRYQGQAYCKMMGINRILYRILHLMGDYKGGGPEYAVWMVKWSDEELEEAWDSIVSHAKYRGWL